MTDSQLPPADAPRDSAPPSRRAQAAAARARMLSTTAAHISSGRDRATALLRLSPAQRIAATGGVAGIVLLLGALTSSGLLRTRAFRDSVDRVHQTITAASALLQDLTDAETGVRGYLVGNDPDYLEPYTDAVHRIAADTATLRRQEMRTPIDTAQTDSLASLVTLSLSQSRKMIARRQKLGASNEAERVELRQGKVIMDDIRALLRRVANRKRVELETLTQQADARDNVVGRTVVIGTIAVMILALAVNYFLTARADAQSRAARRIDAKNNELREANRLIADEARIEQDHLMTRLAMATSIAQVGVWEWHMDSNSISWDDTMFAIYGMERVESIPYDTWASTVSPEDLPEVERTLQSVIQHRNEGSAEFGIVRPDGSRRIVSAIERLVEGSDKVVRMIGVNIDVTERRKIEHELAQGRRDELRFKDEFLSHVSHELRSPLTAIKQFTTILLGGLAGDLSDSQRQYQEIVLKNVRQLQSMIDDLLEVTRLESGKLTVEVESVSVTDLLVDAFDTVRNSASDKGVALSCSVPLDLPLAHADPTRLRQILINLLDNAIKFTPDGGEARIEVSHPLDNPQFLLFEVIDSGSGIDPMLNERLFERLYQQTENVQASRKGLGLGLYICKELVTRQGGEIWVKLNSRIGSTVSFTIPVFSFDNLIAPLVVNGQWPSASTALVMIETVSPRAWRSKEAQDEWVRDARGSIQGCLIVDLDAFLPTLRSGARAELFFVAAFTDEAGAQVMTKRIRSHFDRSNGLKQPGQTITVTYRMLARPDRIIGETVENMVASMAAILEAAVKSHTHPAEAIHE